MYESASIGEHYHLEVLSASSVDTFWGVYSSDKSGCNSGMDIHGVRRLNLTALINRDFSGNVSAFARRIDRKPSQILDVMAERKGFGEKLARYIEEQLNLTPHVLDGAVDVFSNGDNIQPVQVGNFEDGPNVRGEVPLISWVQAGLFCTAIDIHQPGIAEEWIKTTVPIKPHTYALRVVGDSMEPVFPEGIIIIVEPEMEAVSGDFVIARNEHHEATFKQLIKDGPDWFLKPLNPRYPIRPLTTTDEICGVIRSAEHRFK